MSKNTSEKTRGDTNTSTNDKLRDVAELSRKELIQLVRQLREQQLHLGAHHAALRHDVAAASPAPGDVPSEDTESYYRRLYDESPLPYQSLDSEGRLLDVNRAWLELLGYRREEVIGRWFGEFLTPESAKTFVKEFPLALANDGGNSLERVLVDKSGRAIITEIDARVAHDERGNVVRTHAVLRDVTARREAMQKTQEQEALLSNVFNAIQHGMQVVDRNLTVLHHNPVMAMWVGRNFRGEKCYKVLGELEEPCVNCQTQRAMRTKRMCSAVHTPRFPDGVERIIEVSAYPIIDTDGNVNGTVEYAQDITQRVQAEESLRKSQERLECAVRGTDDGIWDWPDVEQPVYWWSPRFFELLGFEDGEFEPTFEKFTELLHPEDRARSLGNVAVLPHQGILLNSELRLRAKTGDYRWFRMQGKVFRNDDGEPVRMAGSARDITDMVQTMEQLRQSESRFRAVAESASNAIIIFDDRQRILFWNRAAEMVFGYSAQEMLDQPVVKIIPMRMREDFLRDLDESKSRKTPQSIKPTTEGVCLRRNGSEFPAEISHSSWEAGGCHYCCAMVRDISHRRDVEQRLRQREVELAHIGRLHVAGELATGLAHELNQPLHSISNFARGALLRLEKGNTEEEDIKAALRQMVAETKRAFQIISRLRMLVRKRVAGVRVEVDINELVNEVLPLFDARVRSMGVVLTRQLAEPLPSVNADPVQISQVIVNLLQNALDAMASVPTNHRRLTVATERRGHEVAVLICDSGEGVSAEVVKQMFVPFYTTKSDGLGIGLSLSRSIVESHTGRIWSKPNSPCGTAVCFALPVREGEKDHGK